MYLNLNTWLWCTSKTFIMLKHIYHLDNRTVYTFVGDPDSIVEAALNAAKVAFNLIDMCKHSGEHPR